MMVVMKMMMTARLITMVVKRQLIDGMVAATMPVR